MHQINLRLAAYRDTLDLTPDVLAVTAARDVAKVKSALRGGAVHYVLKPFTFDMLRDRMRALRGRLRPALRRR